MSESKDTRGRGPVDPQGAARRIGLLLLFSWLMPVAIATLLCAGVDVRPQEDAQAYWKLGRDLASTGFYGTPGAPEAYRPPLYPVWLSGIVRLFGPNHRYAVAANIPLFALSLFLLMRIARRCYGALVAAVAVVLAGTTYQVLTLPVILGAENLFLPLFLGGTLLLVEDGWRWRAARWFAAGLLWGLGVLTRGVIVALPLFLAAAVLLWWPRALAWRLRVAAMILVLMAGFALPLTAWGMRNLRHFGAFIPVTLNGGEVLALGTNPLNSIGYLEADHPYRKQLGLVGTPLEVHRQGMKVAANEILSNPVGTAVKGLMKIYETFSRHAAWQANRQLMENRLGMHFIYLNTLITWQWLVIVVLALMGLLLGSHGSLPSRLLLLGVCAYWVFFHALVHVGSRFRLPVVPLIAIYAAYTVVNIWPLRRAIRRMIERREAL